MPPRRVKSFTGCWTCRAKRRRCDGLRPTCRSCFTGHDECRGYAVRLVWVSQVGKGYYAQKERRFINPEETWRGDRPYSLREVDSLILQCDHWAAYAPSNVDSYDASSPFTVFRADPLSSLRFSLNTSSQRIPKQVDRLLFHHFVTVTGQGIAPPMLTFNPFETIFPASALQEIPNCITSEYTALYHAMLAHAATNMVQLGYGMVEQMTYIAIKYHNLAIKNLQLSIAKENRDYGPFMGAILILMLVEIYGSQSRIWRVHLEGAWNYIWAHEADRPWNNSEIGLFSTHTILILVIGAESTVSRQQNRDRLSHQSNHTPEAISPIRSVASKGVLTTIDPHMSIKLQRLANNLSGFSCLADINLFEDRVCEGVSSPDELYDVCGRISQHLDLAMEAFTNSVSNATHENFTKQQLQTASRVYAEGTKAAVPIHLQRQVVGVAPSAVVHHVRVVFELYHASRKAGWETFVVWPFFIAAVEAYEESTMVVAQQWLKAITSVGMSNRYQIKAIVEEVWKRRAIEAEEKKCDPGDVVINWRNVMADLDIDVLLY